MHGTGEMISPNFICLWGANAIYGRMQFAPTYIIWVALYGRNDFALIHIAEFAPKGNYIRSGISMPSMPIPVRRILTTTADNTNLKFFFTSSRSFSIEWSW